ncbi:hypothetical protein BEWA_008610 [Theileria equi strain WA]|uniref:Pentatricopeptide repeat domain-containing protein n=1 Tax=Theileria equi strain WA TaxID=1537102 RepID=L0B0W6_THEEQ|nr:hypothetical protein BEWA_008610 [Theileria equi strain WA]AFZ81450.1 hypothetical protein BEWA_008610 [Theileria equi strain WA]|eukprot:XP_004831116.1 hypothetical protein BEWA_008610 [Theileria equi strain WA]
MMYYTLRRLSNANTNKVAKYVEKVADLGKRNLLFRVDIRHIYSIWTICKNEEEYKLGLSATNHFYNFGRQLTPEGVNKLFVMTLRCKQTQEAIKLIEGCNDWLCNPPSLGMIYILLGDLISKKDFDSVFRLFKVVRTTWNIRLSNTLYHYSIVAMLMMDKNPLEEALMLYGDAEVMNIRLKEETHNFVLEHALKKPVDDKHAIICKYVLERMINEVGALTSKSYYLIAWFILKYKEHVHPSLDPICSLYKDWTLPIRQAYTMEILHTNNVDIPQEFVKDIQNEAENGSKEAQFVLEHRLSAEL